MSEPTFTKEWLQLVSHGKPGDIPRLDKTISDLAAFALAQIERAERAEAERDDAQFEIDRLEKELGEAEEWILLSTGVHASAAFALIDGRGDIHRTLISSPAVLRARERGK